MDWLAPAKLCRSCLSQVLSDDFTPRTFIMSLYHEAAELLTASSHEGGSLKSRVFGRKNIKSPPNQLYALVFESCKWSGVLKEVIEGSELLKHERKVH